MPHFFVLISLLVFSTALSADEPKTHPEALPPAEALKTFDIAPDLAWDSVLSEPYGLQPVFLNFDEKGRMWVVEYLQYPYPAGLKVLSQDKHWRTVFDKTPPAPPNHDKGRDRISIHEDTNGDGVFDSHKVFVDGLNIVTSCVRGRGGVWVLNPPYLLFYPDKDFDDVPDGDPEVHLSGFGLQDTHSCVNSLRWGPDGWLYAAQGSTVTGNVMRPGLDKKGQFSMGQLIWRYHPESKRYEIFAEGGGNAFGVEIDAKGRVYSGHNGGDTRGFHYVQGAYYRKGFTKHGPLSNPYSFGFFNAMKHAKVPRFTHNFVIYESDLLAKEYQRDLFGIEPLQGRVVRADLQPNGSSFGTVDLGFPVKTSDRLFRPVDIKVGPDGAIYVADFYERGISHRDHYAGNIDRTTGRIYRLRPKDKTVTPRVNLWKLASEELIAELESPNRWRRNTASRLLGDRKDQTVIPLLLKKLREKKTGQASLEYLWALNLVGGFNEDIAYELLSHPEPHVRLWTVRLLGDAPETSMKTAVELGELAERETNREVRVQLACTARRMPNGKWWLMTVQNLYRHTEDANDVFQPLLLWWAVESKCEGSTHTVLKLFEHLQDSPFAQQHLLERLMRRFAQTGQRDDLKICAALLAKAKTNAIKKTLVKGFESAFAGRSLPSLPTELVKELAAAGGGSLSLQLRMKNRDAFAPAFALLKNTKTPLHERINIVQTFGEINATEAVPVLLELLENESNAELQKALLTALQSYSDPNIGTKVLSRYANFSPEVQSVAQSVLVSRQAWAIQLLQAVDAGKIKADTIPDHVVARTTVHRHAELKSLVEKHWGSLSGASTEEMQQRIAELLPVVSGGSGVPIEGKKLFREKCFKCHVLFEQGGRIGPDLTSFKRDDFRNMLINIVNPTAEIREGFETYTVITDDGRSVNGFIIDKDEQVLRIRGTDGQTVTLEQKNIDTMIPQKKSLMPEGILKGMTDQQVRDLFAYLRSQQPLNYDK